MSWANPQPPATDTVGKFWVVTQPTKHSELCDVCFETNTQSMMLQAIGGLRPDEVVGIYLDRIRARKHAKRLLSDRK